MIQKKENICVHYDNELKNAGIKLDEKEKFIKYFIDDDLDITVVEILPKNNLNELTNSRGIIKEIDKYQL